MYRAVSGIIWAFILVFAGNLPGLEAQIPDRVYGSKHREADRLVLLAKERIAQQQYNEAMILLNGSLQYQPDHIDAYIHRALVKEYLDDPLGALTDYQIVLLLDSTYREAAFNKAKLRYEQQQYRQALLDFKKVITMSSSGTQMLYFKGTLLNQGGTAPIESITTTYSMNADVYNYIGLCYHAIEDYGRAITAFDEALSLNSLDANYYVNRGLSHSSINDSEKAVADFNSALALAPDHPIARFNLTQELESSGQLEMSSYDEIIERNPDFASAYINRALAKFKAGDIQGALNDYDRAIKLDSNNPLIYINRALTREKQKNFRAALADYNTAIKLDPGNPKAYRSRGRVLFELAHYELSLEDLNQSIELDPQNSGVYFNRALVHQKLGNHHQCCTDLEHALNLGVKNAARALDQYCAETQ